MTGTIKKRFQLLFALTVLAAAALLLWFADSAMTVQYRFTHGCWSQAMVLDDANILTAGFWVEKVRSFNLDPISHFFYTRVNHRILLYLIVLFSLIGWSASICLRIVQPRENGRGSAHWEEVVASMALSIIAGAIVFLLLVSARLIADRTGIACISEGYAYLASVAGIGAGLFVVKFFTWFEDLAKGTWSALAGK